MRPPAAPPDSRAAHAVRAAREAARTWSRTPIGTRLRVVRRARQRLAQRAAALADTVRAPWRAHRAETLVSEVLPLLDAARFLEREATSLLAPRVLGRNRRPAWLLGSRVEIRRAPFGVVLVIGPANYPLLLPGVQTLQALVAGNAVVVKPGCGAAAAMTALAGALADAGLPDGVLHVLGDDAAEAVAAIESGVDKVVLTGSLETGRDVLGRLARSVTPAVVELSGCDGVIVRRDADLPLAARAVAFGLRFNGGFTCVAPRRILVHREVAGALERELAGALAAAPAAPAKQDAAARAEALVRDALDRGARVAAGRPPDGEGFHPLVLADVPDDACLHDADLSVPLAWTIEVRDDEEALSRLADGPFRLGAAVFGRLPAAAEVARRADAGVVTVNDLIVPTADPRVPFGGRGASGFGVTRGAEGLLEMTRPHCTMVRRPRRRAHHGTLSGDDAPLFDAFVRTMHGPGGLARLRAIRDLLREGRRRSRVRGAAP